MLKLAIVVQGRFHGFDLARELIARGHDVTLFTNYPASIAERFGVPARRTRSLLTHGLAARAAGWSARVTGAPMAEAALHRWFGRWAERELAREAWDLVHVWSGVAEESFASSRLRAGCRLLMRGSAHIDLQARLLAEEQGRAGVAIDRPSAWMIARERREYALADHILVLSGFSRRSFEDAGVPSSRLSLLRLGVRVDEFRPSSAAVEARQRRILAGETLRVLYVGALSYQKGLFDLAEAVRLLDPSRFRFTWVGPVLREARALVRRVSDRVAVVGKVAQHDLPEIYRDADLFLYPTIQDGYAAVMAQAKAAGLPIITTAHGTGLDIVTPGQDGWIVPVRDATAIAARLTWCDENRAALADAAARVYHAFRARDWSDVARDFEAVAMRLCDVRGHEHRLRPETETTPVMVAGGR
jgi:glycosyltransferase involved in cell wall biosynthesis